MVRFSSSVKLIDQNRIIKLSQRSMFFKSTVNSL